MDMGTQDCNTVGSSPVIRGELSINKYGLRWNIVLYNIDNTGTRSVTKCKQSCLIVHYLHGELWSITMHSDD